MDRRRRIFIGLGFLILFLILVGFASKQNNQNGGTNNGTTLPPVSDSRSFYMGFTPFPPDLTMAAVDEAFSFVDEHGDIIASHFDNGIPWIEALEGKTFSDHLRNEWASIKSKTPKGHAVYVSITPLNFDRNDLALYWGSSDGQPLPEPWNTYRLNHPNVKQAYLNYARRVIDFFNPQYLAIGIETNILISKVPEKWPDYKELHKFVYLELKKSYPNLTIFSTIQYEHLRGMDDETKHNAALQVPGVRELLATNDLVALSTYKLGLNHNPISQNYFDVALSFGKPVAIAEMGAISRSVTILGYKIRASEEDQKDFVRFILEQAEKNDFVFIINFITIDYDKLLSKLPADIQEISKLWVYTGLQKSDGRLKPAAAVWDSYLALPLR